MGVATLKKFLIVSHKSEQSEVLNKLQDSALAQVSPYTEKVETEVAKTSESAQYTADVKKTLDLFEKYRDKKSEQD